MNTPAPSPAPFPFTQHTLIRASAGAGKTYSLSSQFIALLYQGASPSSILATTFTRKAAGEILGKILTRLAEAATDQAKAKEVAKAIKVPQFDCDAAMALLRSVSLELHRVNVSTLDAFFSRLAGSFKLELDLPLDPAMVASTDPQAKRARAEGIEAMLAASEPSVMVDMLKRVHHDHVNRSVTGAIDMIVSKLHELYRTSPDRAVWSTLPVPELLEGDTLRYAIEQLEALLRTDLPSRYPKALAESLELAQRGDWETFLGKGIPKLLAENKTTYYSNPIPEFVIQSIKPLFIHAKADRIGRVVTQTLATWELLAHFDKQYDAIRRSRRLLTFSDLPLKLAREIAPTSDIDSPGLDAIYYRLDGQVQHLLLDEFQDTSPLQWQVLKPIAQEIVNHQDQPRSFFCVGDVKQSIYSWRGGCAELFDQLSTDLALEKENHHQLLESYRTSQDVLDVVNDIFTRLPNIAPVRDHKSSIVAEVVHTLHQEFKTHTAFFKKPGCVKLVTSPLSPEDQDDNAQSYDHSDPHEVYENQLDAQIDGEAPTSTDDPHASFVASYIADLVRTHPTREIGVLVRTNAMVGRLIHLLQKQNINASGEGGNPVTDDAAVELILSALTLADHPGNSVARYHVQRSPLAAIIALHDLTPDALETFSHHIRHAIAQQGYAALINHWSSQLALHGNVRSATRLSQLIELAQAFDRQPGSRPGEFVDFVKATPVEEPNPATVRVMTVHKAKGLEFDIVVLPELHGKMGIASRELTMIYRHHPTEEPAAIYRYANSKTRALSDELQTAYEQEERRRLTDDLGAFYVALTRAKQSLHMIIPPLGLTSKNNLKSAGHTDLSPASLLRNILASDIDEQPELAQVLFTQGDENWDPYATPQSSETQPATQPAEATEPDAEKPSAFAPLLKIDLPRSASPSRSWRVVAPSNLEADQRVSVSDLLRTVSADGRSYGSLMHALFEQIDFLTPAPLTDTRLQQIFHAAKRKTPQANNAQFTSAKLAFTRLLTTPAIVNAMTLPPPVVAQGKVELWRERPFAVRMDDALVNGVLDRVVIQRDPAHRAVAATIIDFKTDRLAEEMTHGDAVAVIVARYQPQIAAYRKALATMLKLAPAAIDAKLLLLGPGEVARVF